jgi:hypothetical protein
MFQFPPLASSSLCIQEGILRVCLSGFPHSEISGSLAICASPKHIAAYRVLHRRQMPRHPPCALVYFQLSPSVFRGSQDVSIRVPRFQHQEPILNQPVQCYKKCKKLKCLSTTPVLAFDACTHKEYGSPEKELQRRLGLWVPLIKESKKKVEPSMAGKLPSPIPIRLVIKRVLPGIGGSGMSTSKNAS